MNKLLSVSLAAALAFSGAAAHAQCQPLGWMLVNQKVISPSERLCVYEKNGARISIIVGGLCPMSPC